MARDHPVFTTELGSFTTGLGFFTTAASALPFHPADAMVRHYRDNTGLEVDAIVAAGYGYVRPDGVAVIPIGALAP